ncbi:hypothetical protein HDU92_003434 [Lobulomyces angularis]|nr:hypothetical protein HDU92_003434 [Lobulomyces angularis]
MQNSKEIIPLITESSSLKTSLQKKNSSLQTAATQPQANPLSTTTRDTPNVLLIPASSYVALGMGYFIVTPSIWGLVLCHLLISVAIVLASIIALFSLIMPLQAYGLGKVIPAAAAWPISIALTIIETAIATLLVGVVYLQAFALDHIFDKVMEKKGRKQIRVKTKASRGFYQFLHPIYYGLSILVVLPLQLIPIVGQILLVVGVSYFVAWGAHLHWFDTYGLTWKESKDYILNDWAQYLAYGWVGGILEAIPLFGLFFMITNRIGAALWAVELEKAGFGPKIPESRLV